MSRLGHEPPAVLPRQAEEPDDARTGSHSNLALNILNWELLTSTSADAGPDCRNDVSGSAQTNIGLFEEIGSWTPIDSQHSSPHHSPDSSTPRSAPFNSAEIEAALKNAGNYSDDVSEDDLDDWASQDCGASDPWTSVTHPEKASTTLLPYHCKLPERPKEYTVCDKISLSPKDTKRHEKTIHQLKEPFACASCKRIFRQKDIRDRHQKNCSTVLTNENSSEDTGDELDPKETQRNPGPTGTNANGDCGDGKAFSTPFGDGNSWLNSLNKGSNGGSINPQKIQNTNSKRITQSTILPKPQLMACRDWRHLGSRSEPKACSHWFDSAARLFEHERRNHKQFWCIKCLKRFDGKEDYDDHTAKRHPCLYCRITCLESAEEREEHRKNCDKTLKIPKTWEARWQYRYEKDYGDNARHNPYWSPPIPSESAIFDDDYAQSHASIDGLYSHDLGQGASPFIMEPDSPLQGMLDEGFAPTNITTMTASSYTPNAPAVCIPHLTQNIHPPLVLDSMDHPHTFATTSAIPNGAPIYDNPSAIPTSAESPPFTSNMDVNLLLSKNIEIADLKQRNELLEYERDFYQQKYWDFIQQNHHLQEQPVESPRLPISPPNISPCESLQNAPKRRTSGNSSDGNTSPKQVTRRKLETDRMIEPRTRGRLESFNSFNTSRRSRYSYDIFGNSLGSSYDEAPFVDNDDYNDNMNNEKVPEERS